MLLTIDAGNTRTKWALFDAVGEITWQGVCLNEAITSAEFLPENIKCDRTIIANVAGENHAKSIATQLEKYQIKNIIWAKPAAQACNVINGYTHIETLGICLLYTSISRKSARFSATVRSRHGEFLPASVNVPRVMRISSAVWLST